MEDKEKLIQDVAIKLRELNDLDMLEQFIKDNKNEFVYNEKHYRIRKPIPLEKELANKERMKKYMDYLKDPVYMFKKQLLELYRIKGIDIDGIDAEVKNLYLNEQGLLKKLALTEDPVDIEFLEKEIAESRASQQDLMLYKDELLKYCIEQQLDDFLKFYLVYLVLEIKNDEKWSRVYKSFEEYMLSSEEILQAKASQIFAVMVYNEGL